jgi:hypothetical protein
MQLNGTGKEMLSDCYKANMPSEVCPLGYGQEETIKHIWESESDLKERTGNPLQNTHFGGDDEYEPLTKVKVPSRVILFGDFQHHVGAINHDSNSEVTRMYYVGDGKYKISFVFPFHGDYEYAVAPYGTLSQIYSIDSYPRSGSSTKAKIRIEKDNTIVTFLYDFTNRNIKKEVK